MDQAKLKVRFRKGRGLWEVDYRDDSGLRRRPLFQTEEKAHEHAAEVLKTLGQSIPAAVDREIRLRDYAKQWLAIVEHEKEPKTNGPTSSGSTTTSCPPSGISSCARSSARRSRHSWPRSAPTATRRTA